MDGQWEEGDRRGRCRGGSGCRGRPAVADALPATSPFPAVSLSPAHTPTHAQTHASELIEASGLAPHEAQGEATVTLFFPLHQPPTL